jgi:SAM-dependent methyltransferase
MDYINLFSERAESYILTSKRYDSVLANENYNAAMMLKPEENDVILHLCAGGINIKKYITVNCYLEEVETNPEFAKISGLRCVSPFKLPYPDNTFDKIFILANLHHSTNEERKLLYKEYCRVLKPNGKFVMGDVLQDSKQDNFLNGFVNQYNPCGHNGKFFTEDDKESMIESGFSKVDTQLCQYPWVFHSVDELNDFTSRLFYLKKIEKDKIFDEVIKYLDVEMTSECLMWNWKLLYFTCTK